MANSIKGRIELKDDVANARVIISHPIIQFYFKGAKAGDVLKAAWRDNKGGTDSADLRIGG